MLLNIDYHGLIHFDKGLKVDADVNDQCEEYREANEKRNKLAPVAVIFLVRLFVVAGIYVHGGHATFVVIRL